MTALDRLQDLLDDLVRERIRRALHGLKASMETVNRILVEELREIDRIIGDPSPPPNVEVSVSGTCVRMRLKPGSWPENKGLKSWFLHATGALMDDELERFLATFPDNATSWAQATDEIRDMYAWISDNGRRFPPVGRVNCRTPAEWNQKYKAAIRAGLARLDEAERVKFRERFAGWLTEEGGES